MNKKGRFVGVLAVLATVVVSLLRIVILPNVVAGTVSSTVNLVLLFAVMAALLCLLLACGRKKPAAAVEGKRLTVVSAGAMFTGVAMAVSAIFAFSDWTFAGVMLYPANIRPTELDVTLLYLQIAFGLLGGVFFLILALRWQLKGQAVRGIMRLAALIPLIWSWIRVARYEMSYISSVHVSHHAYDLLLIVSEMLFFLWFARYVSALEDAPPRFLTGIALCTGVLAAAGCITRVAMLLMGNQEAFDACGLITAADLGVAILAFGFAFGQLANHKEPSAKTAPAEIAPAPLLEQTMTCDDMLVSERMPQIEGEEAAYLLDLSGEFITDGDDDDLPERKGPLELEDVINDIISRIENGEK